jgi:hypothetical protein
MPKLVNISESITVNADLGIFAKALPTANAVGSIKNAFFELRYGVDDLVDDLHCTIVYAKSCKIGSRIPFIDKHTRISAYGYKLEFWEGHDFEGYIVLHLRSDDLTALNKKFVDGGFKPTFNEYKPHITLAHPVSKDALKKLTGIMDRLNTQLENDDLPIQMYYGGYVFVEPDS